MRADTISYTKRYMATLQYRTPRSKLGWVLSCCSCSWTTAVTADDQGLLKDCKRLPRKLPEEQRGELVEALETLEKCYPLDAAPLADPALSGEWSLVYCSSSNVIRSATMEFWRVLATVVSDTAGVLTRDENKRDSNRSFWGAKKTVEVVPWLLQEFCGDWRAAGDSHSPLPSIASSSKEPCPWQAASGHLSVSARRWVNYEWKNGLYPMGSLLLDHAGGE